MGTFDRSELDVLNRTISAEEGVSVERLSVLLERAFSAQRSEQDIDDYRLGKRPWKKLKEEVSTVNRYLQYRGETHGFLRFPLNSDYPDCWYRLPNQDGWPTGIEVTTALARANNLASRELVKNKSGRGFIDVQDDASLAEFEAERTSRRSMYTTPQALSAMRRGVELSLSKKRHEKYRGMTLLVGAQLSSLPKERWDEIVPSLCEFAADLPFVEVHLVSAAGEAPWGIALKSESGCLSS